MITEKSLAQQGETTEMAEMPSNALSADAPMNAEPEREDHGRRRRRVRRQSSIAVFMKRLPATAPLYAEPSSPWWVLWILAGLGGYIRETRRQDELTTKPLVFHQTGDGVTLKQLQRIVRSMPSLRKSMKPTFLVGTWSVLNSVAAYMKLGPPRHHGQRNVRGALHFREIMQMPHDGSKIAIDWELPARKRKFFPDVNKNTVLRGEIHTTVVLILHGINNDASFGYIRSAMRSCADKGWVAAGLNFRGCGGLDLATPRGYTAAYTGDLRSVVNTIASRMAERRSLFLVGNSLGANIIVKYLGEEGLSNTLPKCVAGGISLGNPLRIHSKSLKFPWGQILGMGVKKTMILNRQALASMRKGSLAFKKAFFDILKASTVGEIDCIYAPFKIRNEPIYPYNPSIGYESGEAYWKDAGSYQYIPHINVPLLQISAMDDFLVHHNAMAKLNDSLSNPSIIVAKTKSGGHLGWNDATGLSALLFGASWADRTTTEFIEAVLELKSVSSTQRPNPQRRQSLHESPVNETPTLGHPTLRSKL